MDHPAADPADGGDPQLARPDGLLEQLRAERPRARDRRLCVVDLEARFGLDGDLADRLRQGNILYDRDQHGEYFQLYCPTYGEGFIFEIVERRGLYRGYGAPNAPFRIAAQKRQLIATTELAL
jgi:hypothetical protein